MTTGEAIALGTAVCGLIVAVIAVIGLFRGSKANSVKWGQVQQSFEDGLKRLDEWRVADKVEFEKMALRLESHVSEKSIHSNPQLEKFQQDARAEFQRQMLRQVEKLEDKIDKLADKQ